MEKLKQLFSDAKDYVGQLSPRERTLVGAAGGGVVLFFVLILWASISSAITHRKDALEEKADQFNKIAQLTSGFATAQRTRQELEGRLRLPPLQLFGYIESIAKQNGVDVTNMSDRGVLGGKDGAIKEATVEVTLPKIPLDKLLKLLGKIEHSQNIVKVTKLRVRRSFDDKDLLDATLTVSSFQLG